MSGPEIKHSLRKLEFPPCAKEALFKVGQLICGRVPSIKHMDLALDLMSEFVFCEVDRRGNKRAAPLGQLTELQLLEVLFDYFNSTSNEVFRNTVFLSLFSGSMAVLRSGTLSKFISVAIGTMSQPVLMCASVWMQQLGSTSPSSCKLGETIVNDYFVLVPGVTQQLNMLPKIAPQFVANFLTTVTEIFYVDKGMATNFPPLSLLETITCWVTENHKLCVAAQQTAPLLPPGAIAMETTTPLAGLLKWCILAPFLKQHSELYAKLHLALLNSLLEIPKAQPPRAINAKHFSLPAKYINKRITNAECKTDDTANKKIDWLSEDLELSLDRYAQAIQVALSVNCVYGNIEELISQLCTLPQNRLMTIVTNIRKNK